MDIINSAQRVFVDNVSVVVVVEVVDFDVVPVAPAWIIPALLVFVQQIMDIFSFARTG